MYVNDTELVVAENSSGVTYADLLDYITTCDQLTYGVGEAQTAYWWSELCTISDLKMVPVTVTAQTMEDETEGGVVSVCGSGKNIAITAEAAKNYEFIGWYVDSVLIGEDSTMDISVCKDVTVVAQFKKLPIETEYRTVSGWGNYVLGTLSVKNISGEDLKSWSIGFEYDGKIISSWGATLESQENGEVLVSAPKWHKNLKDGECVIFYFIARYDKANGIPEPTNVVLLSKEVVDAEGIGYVVSATKQSEWPRGYVGSIKIENTGDVLIDNWTIEFDCEDKISSVWGGILTKHEGNHYVITNSGYNAEIPVGETVVLGFMGTPADRADKSDVQLRNISLSCVVFQ